MASVEGTIAQKLGKHITQLEYKDLPGEVIDKTKQALLDQLGCMLIGSTLDWNKIIYNFVVTSKETGDCTIVNYGDKVIADYAAYVNGTFGQGAELDDYVDRGGSHPGAASIPVAMALGEREHIKGKTFLTAIVAGFDTAYHIGGGMMPHMMQLGFHPQSVIGVFTAGAVSGKLLKLNAKEMMHALAIAASHASGTAEFDQTGGEVKRVHTGLAVRGGIQSAILAKMGLTGPPTIFEGKRGILRLFTGDKGNPEAVTKDLGREFGVMHSCFKQYPIVNALQSSVDVISELIKEHGIKAENVERIDVGVLEMTLLHGAAIYEPQDTITAQFSLAFSLAIRLLKGSNDISLYMNPNMWHDPEVLALAKKVHPYAVPETGPEMRMGCQMKITLTDGRTVEGSEIYPKGTPRNPNTTEERYEKFQRLASSVLPEKRVEQVIQTVENVEQLEDVEYLVSLLVH